MRAEELLERVIETGADEKGIRDRFCDNAQLYESCFMDFIEEPNFEALRRSMGAGDYEGAFAAAHAIKGLSANLGCTGLYSAVSRLVDSLRAGRYDGVDAEYEQVVLRLEQLKAILSDERPEYQGREAEPASERDGDGPVITESKTKSKSDRLLWRLICAALATIVAIGLLFYEVNVSHNEKVMEESGQHLLEISNQIRLYIEGNIDIDWKIAQSVGDSVLSSNLSGDDPAILRMLQRKRDVWGVSDLLLYTDKGYCTNALGESLTNDVASQTVYAARLNGKHMEIHDSSIVYTVPLEASLTYGGTAVVAVSVVRDMMSFLEDMDFSSFDGTARIYLTDSSGIIISSQTDPSEAGVFNIQTVVGDMRITPLDGEGGPEDFIRDHETAAFLMSDGDERYYGVSTPVSTGDGPLHLFYIVPEAKVNNTMSGFSKQLTIFSMFIILLFAACALAVSIYVHRNHKRLFDMAILTRERMFDLLVKNTRTAFGLFSVNKTQPVYLSANAMEVMGDAYWTLDRTQAGFSIHNERNTQTDNIARVNEGLREWDGKGTFRSGYLCNTSAASDTYFVFELYPIDENGADFVGIAQDVTPVYAREEAARNAMELANHANEAKTRFLSSMSHDIRTPLNAIMNMTNFALESIDKPKRLGEYLGVIHDSAEHLLNLINDVLDMSRIESGRLVVSSAPFNIEQELQRQVHMIRPLCMAKGQTLMTDFSGLSRTPVFGDALKLSQIVANLLSNAVKFTPDKGAVRFAAREIPSLRDSILTVRITVEDNGIGISDEDIKLIFDPFIRASDGGVSQIEGTGLGLSICKSYVEAMGGTIRCESEYGEGSTFTVDLFFKKADKSSDAAEDQVPSDAAGDAASADSHRHTSGLTDASFLGLHALVAEDNGTNRMIAKELLERMGFIADFASDGGEAVRMFTESRPNTYDIVFMDIQMPVMDGYSASLKIRASEHPQAGSIPIVAMTANAFVEDIERARLAGMDGYVNKPIVSVKLAEETKKAFQNKRRSGK